MAPQTGVAVAETSVTAATWLLAGRGSGPRLPSSAMVKGVVSSRGGVTAPEMVMARVTLPDLPGSSWATGNW